MCSMLGRLQLLPVASIGKCTPQQAVSWSGRRSARSGGISRRGARAGLVEEAEMAWVSFPKLTGAGQRLMSDIAATMEAELGAVLEESRTPEDVRYFKNAQGNGEGSVTLRSGKEESKIDFVLGSWLSVQLPFGALNISTVIAMLSPETDAPHLLCEFIQRGPGSLVFVLDLLPRKDLVLEPEYLQRIYEDSELEKIRVELQEVAGVQAYVSSSLYVRMLVSPTALLLNINSSVPPGDAGDGGLDELVTSQLHPRVMKVFRTWLDAFRNKGRVPLGGEKDVLVKRDDRIKSQGVEVDLSSNMPRLFGQEVTDRVVAAFRKGE